MGRKDSHLGVRVPDRHLGRRRHSTRPAIAALPSRRKSRASIAASIDRENESDRASVSQCQDGAEN